MVTPCNFLLLWSSFQIEGVAVKTTTHAAWSDNYTVLMVDWIIYTRHAFQAGVWCWKGILLYLFIFDDFNFPVIILISVCKRSHLLQMVSIDLFIVVIVWV
jgi:hypothetical protein